MIDVKEINKGGVDLATTLGLAVGFGSLALGFIVEGGNLIIFFQISALIIIIGGTIGATIVSYTMKEVTHMPALFRDAMRISRGPSSELVVLFISFAEKARREGILSLEDDINEIENEFLKKGLKMIVDGIDPESVRNVLENEIYLFEQKRRDDANIFEVAGGFSPTMGIIGTVMGLVMVLTRLGGDPKTLGSAVGMAFIATLWGISLANLVWLPISNKLKFKLKKEKIEMELMIMATMAIQNGENPSIIKDKLESYLTDEDKESLNQERPEYHAKR